MREARGLPIMDRATLLTDAYVEVTLGKVQVRTTVQRRTLTPSWDERLRFDVPADALLTGRLHLCRAPTQATAVLCTLFAW